MRVSLKTKIIGLLLGLALAPILKAADKFVTFNQEEGTLAVFYALMKSIRGY